MGAKCEFIFCDDSSRWDNVVSQCSAYDFYHTASYHLLHERQGQGRGVMIVYRESGKVAAMPLLIRSLSDIGGLSDSLCKLNDATSVYGYAGPITNADPRDAEFLRRFNLALLERLSELKVISAFSRFHPLLHNHRLLPYAGQISQVGWTVSIDLTLPLEIQRAKYRRDHKRGIRKARQAGVIAYHDAEWKHYDDFVRLYYMTMQRVDADDYYYFDRAYFGQLRQALGPHLHLFVAELEGAVISAGLFSLFQNIVQSHLSGSDTEYLHYSPDRVLMDEVRIWASSQGAKVWHLGGGRGRKDGLFYFKAGFSDRRHEFKVWKCVVNENAYSQAVAEQKNRDSSSTSTSASNSYFPEYRSLALTPRSRLSTRSLTATT